MLTFWIGLACFTVGQLWGRWSRDADVRWWQGLQQRMLVAWKDDHAAMMKVCATWKAACDACRSAYGEPAGAAASVANGQTTQGS